MSLAALPEQYIDQVRCATTAIKEEMLTTNLLLMLAVALRKAALSEATETRLDA